MSSAVADMVLDANYAGPHAANAEYFASGIEPVAGAGAPCRVMRAGEEAGLDISGLVSKPVVDGSTIRVRVKEISAPKMGGAFLLLDTNEVFQITAQPERLDRARREFTCQTILWGTGA